MTIKKKNINRDSFIFYRSFFESLSGLTLEEKAKCYDAIADYALNNSEPVLEPVTRVVFTLVKPQIDANKKKFENGLKGGRPSSVQINNQTETKPKPKHNQSITKHEPNVNVNENVNNNVNYISEDFKDVFNEWLEYKKARKEKYKTEQSIKQCYNKLVKFSNNDYIIAKQIIDDAMAMNYSGFFEPKIKPQSGKSKLEAQIDAEIAAMKERRSIVNE